MGQSASASYDPESEITSGNQAGSWTLTKPLIGYKKVRCECEGNQGEYSKFIAEVMMPAGARVIRPYESERDDYGNVVSNRPSDKLRTDQLKVNNINAYKFKSTLDAPYYTHSFQCRPINCRSMHDPSYKYEAGDKLHKPDSFNTNVEAECTNGLYFFLKFTDALNY